MRRPSALRIWISTEMRSRIDEEARARGMSASALARSAVRGLLNRVGPRDDHVAALEREVEHLRHVLAEMMTPSPEHARLMAELALTPAEAAILGRLLRVPGRDVPYEALAAAVAASGAGRSDCPSYSTVKVEAFRMRRKLAGSAISVETVYGIGLRASISTEAAG